MKKRNRDEDLIYNKLSSIKVDDSQIKSRVMDSLIFKTKTKKKSFLTSGLAVAFSLFLVIGGSAAILKNSEWFMNKFNPIFKDIVEPIDISSEDQGIKIELISGQKYENNAIVYLSIQDTTGKNRITENTEFKDGLFIGLNGSENSFGYGVSDRLINFDRDTNTVYYELNIKTDANSPLSEKLRLGTSKIYFDPIRYEDELLEIKSENLINSDFLHVEESKIWAGSNLSGHGEIMLKTGKYADMPHGNKNQWISNLGIIDGKLHIQVASNFKKDFGPSDPYLSIKDASEDSIRYESSIIFLTDKNGEILDIENTSLELAEYKYEEFILPITEEKEIYEVYCSGIISSGVTGHWEIETDLTGDNKNVKNINGNFHLGDYTFKELSLNPLGLNLSGAYTGSNFDDNFKVKLNCRDGLIELDSAGGTTNSDKSKFNLNYDLSKPILIEEIKEIIIDDLRIPIK